MREAWTEKNAAWNTGCGWLVDSWLFIDSFTSQAVSTVWVYCLIGCMLRCFMQQGWPLPSAIKRQIGGAMFVSPAAWVAQPLHPSLCCRFSTRLLPFSVSSPTPAAGPPASFHVSISSFVTDLLYSYFIFSLHKKQKVHKVCVLFSVFDFPQSRPHKSSLYDSDSHTWKDNLSVLIGWLMCLWAHTGSRLMSSCHCSSLQPLTLLLRLRGWMSEFYPPRYINTHKYPLLRFSRWQRLRQARLISLAR